MVSGIEHTAIASPDPHQLAQWYVDHLGFVINYQSSKSRTVFVKAPDGSMIEIIESSGAASAVPGMRDPGIRHMALTVADFPAAVESLKSRGVPFLSEPQTSGGNSLVFFTDCDGNILHLLHREKPLEA
jgi:glyoxylase I family protein